MGTELSPRDKIMQKYTKWGYTRSELVALAEEHARATGQPCLDSRSLERFLEDYMISRHGEPIRRPTGPGQSEEVPPWRQRHMTASAMALLSSSVIVRGADDYSQWPRGYIQLPGQQALYKISAFLGTWGGTPGSKPGTVATEYDLSTQEGIARLMEDIQCSASCEQPDEVVSAGEDIVQQFPVRFGPDSPKRDVGFPLRTVGLLEQVLPEHVAYYPEGHISEIGIRKVKEIEVPVGCEVRDLKKGKTWHTDESVVPFNKCMPIDLGLGQGCDSATLVNVEQIREGTRSIYHLSFDDRDRLNDVQTEEVPGHTLRMTFDCRGSLGGGGWVSKFFSSRHRILETDTSKMIPSVPGTFAILELTKPALLATQWFGVQPILKWRKALAEARGIRNRYQKNTLGITFSKAVRSDSVTWQDVGRELATWFAENVVGRPYEEGGMYAERDLVLVMRPPRYERLKRQMGSRARTERRLGGGALVVRIRKVAMLVPQPEDKGLFTQLCARFPTPYPPPWR